MLVVWVAVCASAVRVHDLQSSFDEHGVWSGRSLLLLEEAHVKEMGVVKVGHRLELCDRLRELRRAAKVVAGGIDVECLLSQ